MEALTGDYMTRSLSLFFETWIAIGQFSGETSVHVDACALYAKLNLISYSYSVGSLILYLKCSNNFTAAEL